MVVLLKSAAIYVRFLRKRRVNLVFLHPISQSSPRIFILYIFVGTGGKIIRNWIRCRRSSSCHHFSFVSSVCGWLTTSHNWHRIYAVGQRNRTDKGLMMRRMLISLLIDIRKEEWQHRCGQSLVMVLHSIESYFECIWNELFIFEGIFARLRIQIKTLDRSMPRIWRYTVTTRLSTMECYLFVVSFNWRNEKKKNIAATNSPSLPGTIMSYENAKI